MMTEKEKLSERMSSGSFSPTNDGVLTCDECGREPDDVVFHCSSHEDAQHKKEVAALEQRVAVVERIANDANDGRSFTGITAERYREWCKEALAQQEKS